MSFRPALSSAALRHGEKPLFLLSLVWLGAAGVAHGAVQDPGALAAAAEASLATIQAHASQSQPEAALAPAWRERVAAQLAAPAAVPALPAWALHRRPTFLFSTAAPPPPVAWVHEPPQVEVVAVGRGEVRLRWGAPRLEHLVGVGLDVERASDAGPFETVARLGPEAREHVDLAAAPARYRYRLVSRARVDGEDPKLRALAGQGEVEAPAEVLVRRSVGTAGCAPLPTLVLRLNSVRAPDPVHEPTRRGSAYIYVEIWDRERGDFSRRGVLVEVGEPVDAGAFASGAVLLEVGVEERADPEHGHLVPVQWARVRLASGAEALLSDRD